MNSERNLFHYGWLLVAVVTRISVYLFDRTLFQDELALAKNLMERDWQQLLKPLSFNQAAPPGYLLVSEAFVSFFGVNSFTLRFFPLVLSLLACIALFELTSCISPRLVPLMMIWFATSNIMLRYATEFKQYGGDVFFTLLLMLIAVRILETASLRWIGLWGLCGVVFVWFSHPVVFVLAGVGLCLIVFIFRDGNRRESYWLIAACLLSATSFLAVYLSYYDSVARETNLASTMQNYWQNDFFEFNWIWLIRYSTLLLRFTAGFESAPLLIFIMFGFAIGLRRMKRRYVWLFLSPVFVTMVASSLELYPLRNRFLLFMLPGVMLICATGLKQSYTQLRIQYPVLATLSVLILYGLFLVQMDLRQYNVEVRPALEYLETNNSHTTIYTNSQYFDWIAEFYEYELDVKVVTRELESKLPKSLCYIALQESTTNPPSSEAIDWQLYYSTGKVVVYCSP